MSGGCAAEDRKAEKIELIETNSEINSNKVETE